MDLIKISELLDTKQPVLKWKTRYLNYLKACKNSKKTHKYTELHHILPRAADMFSEYADLRVHKWNSIRLSMRQHIFCHIILAKMFPSSKSCCGAIYQMFIKPYKNKTNEIQSALRLAEFSKNAFSDRMKGTTPVINKLTLKTSRIPKEEFDPEIYYTCSDYRLNHSPDKEKARKKVSERVKNTVLALDKNSGVVTRIPSATFYANPEQYSGAGIRRDENSRKKTGIALADRKHFHNPETNERLFLRECDVIPDGFVEGMPEKFCEGMREISTGSLFYHNPLTGENIRCKGEPPAGFVKGKTNFGKKGNTFSKYGFGISLLTGLKETYELKNIPNHVVNPAKHYNNINLFVIEGVIFNCPDSAVLAFLREKYNISLGVTKLAKLRKNGGAIGNAIKTISICDIIALPESEKKFY